MFDLYGMFTKTKDVIQYIIVGAYRCIKAQYKSSTGANRSFENQLEILNICGPCEYRDKEKCGECGCILTIKVQDPKSVCPLGFWE